MADIVQSISINAAKDVIFPLVSSAHGFQHWSAADVTEDEDTEIVELGFFNRGTIYRLKPVKNSTPWTAEWFCESGQEWAGTTLLFAMTEANGKTQLNFTHSRWKAETPSFVSCAKTWGDLMPRIKAAAEGQNPGPFFTKDGTAP